MPAQGVDQGGEDSEVVRDREPFCWVKGNTSTSALTMLTNMPVYNRLPAPQVLQILLHMTEYSYKAIRIED